MKKERSITLYFAFSFLLFLSCRLGAAEKVDKPSILEGKSKISGTIIKLNRLEKDSIYVNLAVAHPISGEVVLYKAPTDQSGKFSIDIEVETDISFVALYTTINRSKPLLIKTRNGGVTNIDLTYNSDYNIGKINISPVMNQYDMTERLDILENLISKGSSGKPATSFYDKHYTSFLEYIKSGMSKNIVAINDYSTISDEMKGLLSKELRLHLYTIFVFDYEKYMIMNYRNITKDIIKKPNIQNVDKSYYAFLKDFNLNDPQYLNCLEFDKFQKQILQNEILNIPKIGDTDIRSWLVKVKATLSDLIGFKDGQYYDILVANAYGRQLTEETEPLSDKQKANILNYWKKGEIPKILFRKNKQVVEMAKLKSPVALVDISSVSDDKVMEAIVSRHKGKAVFIDLWATWCIPCLDAMREFSSTKAGFNGKDVAFVYVTNGSSPRKLWEEKIKGIGNEHYYLNSSQWNYMMGQFRFEGIPSYLLYDKNGVLINKFTAFPGNEKVKEMINNVL